MIEIQLTYEKLDDPNLTGFTFIYTEELLNDIVKVIPTEYTQFLFIEENKQSMFATAEVMAEVLTHYQNKKYLFFKAKRKYVRYNRVYGTE